MTYYYKMNIRKYERNSLFYIESGGPIHIDIDYLQRISGREVYVSRERLQNCIYLKNGKVKLTGITREEYEEMTKH